MERVWKRGWCSQGQQMKIVKGSCFQVTCMTHHPCEVIRGLQEPNDPPMQSGHGTSEQSASRNILLHFTALQKCHQGAQTCTAVRDKNKTPSIAKNHLKEALSKCTYKSECAALQLYERTSTCQIPRWPRMRGRHVSQLRLTCFVTYATDDVIWQAIHFEWVGRVPWIKDGTPFFFQHMCVLVRCSYFKMLCRAVQLIARYLYAQIWVVPKKNIHLL